MIGIALVNQCIENEVEVLAIVRRKSKHLHRLQKSDLLKIYECDLDQLDSMEKDDKCCDVFYHLAWDYTIKKDRDNPILQETNIKYTLQAVELARRLGCTKFIGAGSQAEYGKVDSVIGPDTQESPLIAYGMAKCAAGKLSRKLCEQYGMEYVWARIFSVYGRYDSEETMISYAISCFLENKTARFSAAMQNWDYLSEKDAGKIFYLLGKCAVKSGVYCIAHGKARPLRSFIEEIRAAFPAGTRCEFAKEEDSKDVIGLQADISGLISAIGYTPEITFEEGIKDVIKYKRQSTL